MQSSRPQRSTSRKGLSAIVGRSPAIKGAEVRVGDEVVALFD
jgi:hypothetical protein